MKLWQGVLKELGQLTEKITNRLRVNSLKGFFSLFLVGISLSVAIAACRLSKSTTPPTPLWLYPLLHCLLQN